MDDANSDKKFKKVARNKKRQGTELPEAETTEFFGTTRPDDVNDGKNRAEMSDKKRNKLKKKKREKEKRKDGIRECVPQCNEDEDYSDQQIDNLDGAEFDKKMKKVARKKKRKCTELPEAETTEIVVSTTPHDVNEDNLDGAKLDKKRQKIARKKKRKCTELPEAETPEIAVSITQEDVNEGKNSAEISDKKRNKLKKKKKVKENRKKAGTREYVPLSNAAGDDSNKQSGKSKSASQIENEAILLDDDDEVYHISSGEEDETTGMKRWITKYHRARPGAEVLLERINDFLVDYWAQKEKERKEREDEAAEGGWTVVTHLKGRKKTTDAESGTTVGSVAQAAVMDKMSKKKDKQVGIGFYSFQKREARRNEIMMLQSKFEQDKKRIQQMRAARKFRPY